MAIDPALLAGRRVKAWAMVYANDGLPVFLLRPGEKVPMISRRDGGRGFYDATTDADQSAAWCARYPHANIAIRTGAESGLLVIDVDPRNGGSLEELYARFPELRQTRTAQSANGGWHLYLRYPGFAVASGQNVLGPGIDVKCDKGYIVAHPSWLKSGGKYRWHNRYETPPIACPPTLVEALEAYAAGSTRDSADRTEGTPRYSPLAARLLAGALVKTQDGTGDVTGYMLARKLLAGGCGELEALDVLALTTGMRQGELLALVWEDVDLEIGVIHVRHTLQHGSAGAWTLESPKTAKSRREVELNPSTVEALQAHRTAQLEARLAAGPLWHDHGLVFTRGDGEPMRGTHLLQRHFHPFLRRAGLPLIRFHDLRHTAATQLLLQGINSKVVQERLGHSNVGITLDRYSHVLPGMQREAALAMERLFQRDPTRGPMVRVK